MIGGRRGQRGLACWLCFGMAVALLSTGCRHGRLGFHRGQGEQAALVALKSNDADQRYEALMELCTSKSIGEEWSVKALCVIGRTDENPLVRTLAVHGLGLVGDERIVETAIGAVGDEDPRVRSEATWALASTPYDALVKAEQTDQTKAVLLKGLTQDSNVDVRLHCATALSKFKDRDVLMALITALKDTDFAVRFHAERSLIGLTGETFRTDAAAWVRWVESVNDPFEKAGQIPAELRRPKQNLFRRGKDRIYQWYLDWQGPAKP